MSPEQALIPQQFRPRPSITEFLSRFIPKPRIPKVLSRRIPRPRVSELLARLIPKPLLFTLIPSEPSFANEAPYSIDNKAWVPAPPELVYDEFSECPNGHAWLISFARFDTLTPGEPLGRRIHDETFILLRLRLRMLEAERGKRWVCSIDSSSIPFARQLMEDVTFEPAAGGGTNFHWRIYYTPSWLARPVHRLLRPIVHRLFRRNTEQLAAFFRAQKLIPEGAA